MAIRSSKEKFAYELGAAHDAERRFLDAMTRCEGAASNDQLRQLLRRHIGESEQQIRQIEQLFSTMGQSPPRAECQAAVGLIRDGETLLNETQGSPQLCDLAIAGSQYKAEYHEIASYRGLVNAAEQMGQNDAARVLRQILQQEEQFARDLEQAMPQLLRQASQVAA